MSDLTNQRVYRELVYWNGSVKEMSTGSAAPSLPSFLPFYFRVCAFSIQRTFRAEKRSAQSSAHPLSQAQGGLFCVLTGLFFAGVLIEMHEVRTFAPCKAFSLFALTCLLCFRRLKITLDSEKPMLRGKRIIPSVWGGIKGFEHFLRGGYFSDCASD